MLNKLNLKRQLTQLAGRSKAALAKIALASVCALGWASVAQADYVWSGDITLGAGGTTATGSVGVVNYTISSTAAFQRAQIWNPDTFADTYNVPGDTGGSGGANVYTFNENAGGTYTLTFDRPVENPLIAIASLGQVGTTGVGFTFGSSVNLLWTGTYQAGGSVTPSNGTTTSITGVEGYAIAKYSGTITSVTFTPDAEPNGSMMVLVGFEVSATAPTITAPGGTAGASTAAISVPELQTTVGDFNANKAVTWSITGGADQAKFSINSATGALSFASAPAFLSPTDSDTNNTYVVELTATDLQATPQTAVQTVTVTVTDATAPTVTFSPTNAATGVAVGSDITLTFSEAVRLIDDTALSDTNVDALITLKNTDANGADIPFDATISGNVITINPTSDFSNSQQVYVAIGATVEDSANNAITASNATFTTAAPASDTPASEFERYREEIKAVIVDDATRSLSSSMASNQRLVQGARSRFIAGQKGAGGCGVVDDQQRTFTENDTCDDTLVSRNSIPFDIAGSAVLSGGRLSSSGTFFGQAGNFEGTSRRLVFGDFDVQHDSETGSTTATLNGKVAWERMVSDKTMLGYFIGGELARSEIGGSFSGDQDRLGLTLGGYAVHQLAANLYADGFVSVGAGRNNLNMANDVLTLESDYTTRTATVGAALSGVIERKSFEIWPELAFSYGRTWIGTVGFTGTAFGLVDDTLSLDAGNVSIANLTFRPEVRVPLDNQPMSASLSVLSFAPRLVCQQVKTTVTQENCGAGAELGITGHSADGLSNITARVLADRIGNQTSSSLQLNIEHKF